MPRHPGHLLARCGLLAVVLLAWPGLPLAAQAPGQAPAIDFSTLRDEAARRLSEYLRINTTNPPGNELAAARWLKDVLAREGIEGQILDTAELGPGRANFYARVPGATPGHGIALVHHMDVVPVTRAQWTADPFGGEIKKGSVWGRGALDMKGHGILQLLSLIALKRAGVPLAHDVVLIGNADEEIDGLGTRTFIRRHPDLLKGVEYLLTEGADTRVEHGKVKWFGIDVGEKRAYWQRVTARGTTSHASVPLGDNPVDRLVVALGRLVAWRTPVRLTAPVDRFFKAQARYETGERRRWLADAGAALATRRGRAWLLSSPERNALLRSTVTPTVLAGSNRTNIIPEEASAEIDIRLLPDEDTTAFRRELLRVLADPKLTVTTIGDVGPRFDAPLDTPLFHAIERVAGRMLPRVPVATPISAGASDRPYYAAAGITCYGLDPWLVELEEDRLEVHGNDERLSLKNIEFGLRLYTGILQEMAK
ncbi:MAG TPA: M20/M25/M40 family metallo-hydrolase [Gemmatimonadales bacterium]|jgi:acetylornithine deacetylase/succinyl-diaminopimelate desuccinylase-like protein|nr:M20/M25/M40 family metallo-hydrolase [Gemmatimonadales bacterium]